jgi:hypothetical protein
MPREQTDQRSKTCVTCGRSFSWRKKWSRDWEQVKHCSDSCRRTRLTSLDHDLENAILKLLQERGPKRSICPSEAVREFINPEHQEWKVRCRQARQVAQRLAGRGEVEITQAGVAVDPARARGPIRIRLPKTS